MPSPSSTNKGVSTSLYFPRGRVKTIRFAAASFAYHFPTFLPTGKTLICMRRRKKRGGAALGNTSSWYKSVYAPTWGAKAHQPMVTSVVPSITLSPAATQTPVTLPSHSAVMLFSIFMASSTTTVSPFFTA